ncbi:LysE family translocator [Streptomyces avicenniae]|uniref:LysE family translocator n=1 Tax=Streptomyces avicenniae TaxID=500153 RepID=UPI00069BA47D|nr:LysE family translocator [Streptomyces avicenniae]
MWSNFAAFLGACTLIALSPGPSTVLIVRQSLRSRRAGMWTVLGNESGVFVWGLCAALGLTAVLEASEVAYDVIHVVGAVVLLGFGVQALRAARRGDLAGLTPAVRTAEPTDLRDYRAGLLLNLANPKAGIFALAFLPQFVPEGAPHFASMVALAAFWAVFEVGFYSCYVWGVSRLSAALSRPGVRRRLEQVSGGVMIALGIRLALDT